MGIGTHKKKKKRYRTQSSDSFHSSRVERVLYVPVEKNESREASASGSDTTASNQHSGPFKES